MIYDYRSFVFWSYKYFKLACNNNFIFKRFIKFLSLIFIQVYFYLKLFKFIFNKFNFYLWKVVGIDAEDEQLLHQLVHQGDEAKENLDEGKENDHMATLETYADYIPTKLKIGKQHPDPVVETASLSSVEPPDIW